MNSGASPRLTDAGPHPFAPALPTTHQARFREPSRGTLTTHVLRQPIWQSNCSQVVRDPMPTLSSSQRFWNRKAKENPYWYVSTFGDYDRPDLPSFWASGVSIWEEIKAHTGYEPGGSDTIVE